MDSFMRSLLCLIFFSTAGLMPAAQKAHMWVSSELYPENPRWFTNPPDTSEIMYKLTPVDMDSASDLSAAGDVPTFMLNSHQAFQSILGIGTSLEETSVYAILKNKTDEHAKEILRALIDPQSGIGMKMLT